jgi:acyl-CoA thioester hydrolase
VTGFVASIPIRYSDLDLFGHVNHARYLTYCEDHRTVMFTQMGKETGTWLLRTGFVVARIECDYRRPLTLDDGHVAVTAVVDRLGRSSVGLTYEISTAGQSAATVRTTLVMTADGAARPLTEVEREWFGRYTADESS